MITGCGADGRGDLVVAALRRPDAENVARRDVARQVGVPYIRLASKKDEMVDDEEILTS